MCCLRSVLLSLTSGILLCFLSGVAAFEGQEELYAARVPIGSQEPGERQKAFQLALEQVLIKASGKRTLPQHPIITEALSRPERYVAQFRYYSERDSKTSHDEMPTRTLYLWAEFDAAAVEALLRSANAPVWGQARPSVLLWFALEQGNGPVVLGADSSSPLTAVLEGTAAERGLPLILPLLDLEDRARLSESDLWGGFEDDILAASRRYQSEAVLVGRAYHLLSNQWETRWRLFLSGTSRDWSSRGAAIEPLLREGIHQAAGYVADRSFAASRSPAAEGVELVVGGISTLEDYAILLSYLQTLEVVETVQVKELQGDRAWFLIKPGGRASAIRELLALNRRLLPVGPAETLEFELQP